MKHFITLADRTVIGVSGSDAENFLQGLVSNDVSKLSSGSGIYAAFLTAQGKYLFDLHITKSLGTFLIDCELSRADDLIRRLSIYKLRSNVTVQRLSDRYNVAAIFADSAPDLGVEVIQFRDSRHPDIGFRAIIPASMPIAQIRQSDRHIYDYALAKLGIPNGSKDLEIDRAIILENGFDELNGIDWNKGCYMGQELTARTKYRGLVRKRLIPCKIEKKSLEFPMSGSLVQGILPDGKTVEAGETRSAVAGYDGQPSIVLALLRIEHVLQGGTAFSVEGTTIEPYIPNWVKINNQD